MKIAFVSSDIIINECDRNTVILSLLAHPLYDNISNLIPLIPPPDIFYDSWYWEYVLSYTAPFLDLMKIVYPLYEGKDVLIIVPLYLSDIFESLGRFLYNRYDLMVSFVTDPEDFYHMLDTDFSFRGLGNLDQDKFDLCAIHDHMKPFIPVPQPVVQPTRLYQRI